MGAKLTKFDEPMRLGASEFYRAQQTVIAIAQGRGQDTTVTDTFPELNDDWYMIDRELVNRAESDAGGGWEATSYYTYTGRYSGDTAKIQAYYNLEERSAELIEILLDKYENEPDRFIMLSSHDKLMVPFVAYCSKLRINMNIKKGGTWINYLAGIAIIWDKSGNRRYVAFKGLKNAYFQGW
jgi:broad specificity phosphatase PhoE